MTNRERLLQLDLMFDQWHANRATAGEILEKMERATAQRDRKEHRRLKAELESRIRLMDEWRDRIKEGLEVLKETREDDP